MKKPSQKQVLYTVANGLCALLLSGGIMLLAIRIQPNGFSSMLSAFAAQKLLPVLNLLPIFLMLVCLGALFRNVFWGASLLNVLVCGCSIANRLKVELRDEPLFPRDFLLLREAEQAVKSYDVQLPLNILAAVLAVTVLLAVLGVFYRKRVQEKPVHVWPRLLLAASSAAILCILTLTVFASTTLYYSFDCTNSYNIAGTYDEYGFPYSFFHYITANSVERPEGFDLETARAWDSAEGTEADGGAAPVHVIMVMDEGFSDLTDYGMFSFSEEDDPLAFFHTLQQDAHAVTGHTVVPNFGGGTANTEFDVLTGMQAAALSSAATSAFDAVSRNLDSLFRVYRSAGYVTGYLHPGYTWFYNRQNVYQRLGADSMVFYEDMTDRVTKGTWVTDDYVADRILLAFEEAVADGDLLFQYTTTIQNHMSYTADKYGEDYVFPDISVTVPLSEEAETTLKVYAEGVRDADAMLEKLVGYFSEAEEPVVLVFWGDHFPNLGSSLSCYQELGVLDTLEYPFQLYATPFVIWTNDAGAEALDWENAIDRLDLPENGYLSASFLGAAVLELCGLGDSTSWYAFLNQLRRTLPVVWYDAGYLDADGNLLDTLTEEQQRLISQWRCWSYYKLKYKEI